MAEEHDYQICPSCKGEFTLVVTRCTECDVDLVAPGTGADDFPPASELTCIRIAAAPWIQALSDGLEEREILHRVESVAAEDAPAEAVEVFGKAELFGLYVDDSGVEVARSLDGQLVVQALPEQHADLLEEGEVEACPACGESLPPDAVECPECGLAFGG